ncbi:MULTISPECIES: FAD:protein FMN transferase [Tenacibaculum]|uniref:FAD:protein FMN transferase n=1 Tax=Tenacibaculum TaxID=104267 RepID=UPI001F0A1F01|nr:MULTISPECIES: FAD:protein FMN transferase [Tenacibaculum]MCH3881054.1 FAD:protein FMN transferase [Tenacibaculum aquimarinum]MDO6599346.1 FAD:protein FMN transferase [Tenacibaculum sp. 1_MG-2023]
MKNTYLVFIISCIFLLSCKDKHHFDSIKISGNVFGTTYNITYLNTNVSYQKSIDSLFLLVNKSLSTYIPTSDISKINTGDSTIVIDEFFKEVFQKSIRIHNETNGYFDPTVGNLVNSWGFGPKNEKKNLDSLQVNKMMQLVGLDKVSLVDGKIKKDAPEIYLDFNSIAKGYGIDVIGRFFESKNLDNYLIEIGGEIRARGKNSKNKNWRVAIDNPNTDGTRSFADVVALDNQSMASSGNYRKFRLTENGQKYVHTVNPITGFATESNLLSATVYAPLDCADVDAYATAFMAMGLEKTKEFLEEHTEVKAILMYVNKNGDLVEYKNSN